MTHPTLLPINALPEDSGRSAGQRKRVTCGSKPPRSTRGVVDVLGDPATIAHKFAVLKKYCEAIGRDYERIRRATIAICLIADTDEQAEAQMPEAARAFGRGGLVGSPDTVRKRIAALEEAGVQELMLRFPNARDLNGLRRFAQEFIA